MKRISIILLAVIMTFSVVLTGCTKEPADSTNGDQATNETDNIVAAIEVKAATFPKIIELRGADPIDMEQYKKIYTEVLSPVIADADKIVPGLKAQADNYLADAEKNDVKTPHLQGAEKSTLYAFVTMMKKNLNDMESNFEDKDSALSSFKQAKAYYGAVQNTAKRRGSMFKDENKFHNQFIGMFNTLESEVNSGNKDKITEIKTQIVDLTDAIYVLSVLAEINGINDNRGKNDVAAWDKLVEGKVFLQVAKESAKDADALKVLEDEFSKSVSEINTAVAKEKLIAAFPDVASTYKDIY